MRLRFLTAVAAFAALTAASAANAQGMRPTTGTVKSITATDIVLTTDSGDVALAITPQTRVVVRQSAAASDIKPGAYLGTSNQNSADGAAGTATEVHLMDNGPNVHYAMNQSGLMMTNGHVKNVTTTDKGQEMDVDYGQGTTRHVVVTKDTSMSRMVDVGVAGLKPGTKVSALTGAAKDGGKAPATFITVATPAAK